MSELGEDVTDRLRAEEALRDREQLLQTVLAHIPCGVYWKDRDGRYLGCNGQVAGDLGLASPAEAVGKTDGELLRADERIHRVSDLSVVQTGEAVLNEEEGCDRPGRAHFQLTSRVPLRDPAGMVVGVLGMYQDITERKRLEDKYRQAQKMEAVGQLAGGIAHDFNNLLTVINGYSQLLTLDGDLTSQQVLMNLAVNARDAMPTGGKITISTRSIQLTSADICDIPDATAGEYAELTVSDTGCGMTAEVQEHLFEPFFTTKDVGKGTGLGLATAFGIVSAHGGHIRVESEPAMGTTFRVYLPSASESMLDTILEVSPTQIRHQGDETVLLAEDEPGVRSLAAKILRTHGYEVLEAENGEDAIRLAGQHPGPIDLLVTDVVMPGRGGRKTAEAILGSRPGLRVIFMSGYTDDAMVRNGVMHDRVHFLPKPFSPAALVQEVRDALFVDASIPKTLV